MDFRTNEAIFTISAKYARMRDLIGRQLIFVGVMTLSSPASAVVEVPVRSTSGGREIDRFVASGRSSSRYAAVRDRLLNATDPSRRAALSTGGQWLTHTIGSSAGKDQIEVTLEPGNLRPTAAAPSMAYYIIEGGPVLDCASLTVTLPTRLLTVRDKELDASCEENQVMINFTAEVLGSSRTVQPLIRIRTEPTTIGGSNPQGTAVFLDATAGRTILIGTAKGLASESPSAPSASTTAPASGQPAGPSGSDPGLPWWIWAGGGWVGIGACVLGAVAVARRRHS